MKHGFGLMVLCALLCVIGAIMCACNSSVIPPNGDASPKTTKSSQAQAPNNAPATEQNPWIIGNALVQAAQTDAESVLFTYTAHTLLKGKSVEDGTKIIVCKSQKYFEFTYANGVLMASKEFDTQPLAEDLVWEEAPQGKVNTGYVEVNGIDGMLAGTAVFAIPQN